MADEPRDTQNLDDPLTRPLDPSEIDQSTPIADQAEAFLKEQQEEAQNITVGQAVANSRAREVNELQEELAEIKQQVNNQPFPQQQEESKTPSKDLVLPQGKEVELYNSPSVTLASQEPKSNPNDLPIMDAEIVEPASHIQAPPLHLDRPIEGISFSPKNWLKGRRGKDGLLAKARAKFNLFGRFFDRKINKIEAQRADKLEEQNIAFAEKVLEGTEFSDDAINKIRNKLDMADPEAKKALGISDKTSFRHQVALHELNHSEGLQSLNQERAKHINEINANFDQSKNNVNNQRKGIKQRAKNVALNSAKVLGGVAVAAGAVTLAVTNPGVTLMTGKVLGYTAAGLGGIYAANKFGPQIARGLQRARQGVQQGIEFAKDTTQQGIEFAKDTTQQVKHGVQLGIDQGKQTVAREVGVWKAGKEGKKQARTQARIDFKQNLQKSAETNKPAMSVELIKDDAQAVQAR